MRAQWNDRILALAPALACTIEEIDAAGSRLHWAEHSKSPGLNPQDSEEPNFAARCREDRNL